MRICLDTNVLVSAALEPDSDSAKLLARLAEIDVLIPAQVMKELVRNLSDDLFQQIYDDLHRRTTTLSFASESLPGDLIARYVAKGLSIKGDAVIAAFAEHFGVEAIVSLNRDFLRLARGPFEVLTPQELLDRLDLGG